MMLNKMLPCTRRAPTWIQAGFEPSEARKKIGPTRLFCRELKPELGRSRWFSSETKNFSENFLHFSRLASSHVDLIFFPIKTPLTRKPVIPFPPDSLYLQPSRFNQDKPFSLTF